MNNYKTMWVGEEGLVQVDQDCNLCNGTGILPDSNAQFLGVDLPCPCTLPSRIAKKNDRAYNWRILYEHSGATITVRDGKVFADGQELPDCTETEEEREEVEEYGRL